MLAASTTAVITTEWTLLGVCLTLILARFHLRLHLRRTKLILSDYVICLAWLSGACEAALDLELKELGWLDSSSTWQSFQSNMHISYSTQMVVFIGWLPLFTTQYLNKAALLAFFFNIFPSILLWFRYCLWAVTIYSGAAYITSVLLMFLICLPYKTKEDNFTFCGAQSQLKIWTITWALHFSSDIFVFILPLLVLRTLRLDCKKKCGLYVTFGFGILSISACLIRFLTIVVTYPDVPTTNVELWCALDSYLGLIAACLPSLRPYLNLKQVNQQQIHQNNGSRQCNVLDPSLGSEFSLDTLPEAVPRCDARRLSMDLGV